VGVATEKRDRHRAWGLTWLAYATYYTGRKGFSVAKTSIVKDVGLSEASLGAIDTAYLISYALGQFANGILGDRIGARRLVGYGMLLSAACCMAFASASTAALMLLFFCINGYAQSTGWPGTTRAMAEWTTPANRGTVMAFWATCYQVGGIAASFIAGALLVRFGWRSAFVGPALLMSAVGVLILLLLRPAPWRKVLARQPTEEPERLLLTKPAEQQSRPEIDAGLRRSAQRAVLGNPTLWLYGASYFFIKFIRYALLFWLPYYLTKQLNYAEDAAAYASTAFEAGGIAGVIVIGTLSDRLARLSRSGLAAFWLAASAVMLFLYASFAASSVVANVVILSLVGATLFGPDSLISGAAAQDAGGRHAAATATGFVNGLGSLGAILEGIAVPPLAKHFGWGMLFPMLAGLAVLGALALLPTLGRARVVRADD